MKKKSGHRYIIISILVTICLSLFSFQCANESNAIEEKNSKRIGQQNDRNIARDLDSSHQLWLDSIVKDYLSSAEESMNRLEEFPPKGGIVPDKETAKRIAEAIWLPLYGDMIYDQRPYRIKLINDSIWLVHGNISGDRVGMTVYAKIRKTDGKVVIAVRGK